METATKKNIEYSNDLTRSYITDEYIERRVKEHEQEVRNIKGKELKQYYADLRKKLNIKTT